MLEVLTFVFSSFWTFAGTVVLLSVIVGGLASWTPVRITHVHKHGPQRDDPPVT
jgi:hypothetical protein